MAGQWLKNTFQTGVEAFARCAKRFPVTVGFVLVFTTYLLYLAGNEAKGESKLLAVLTYYLSMGSLLSLSMHLWGEEWRNKARAALVHAGAQTLLLADAIILYQTITDLEILIAHSAGILALGLSVFFLSFLKEKNDIASCNFAARAVASFVIANVIGVIMSGGICLLVYSLNQLFGIAVNGKYYLYICILCNVLLPSLLFLGLLPQNELKHDRYPQTSSFQEGIIRYLFLPLITGYLAVLYIYAARILFMWELPTGWVSWLVVTLMTGCICIEYGLYSLRLGTPKRWEELTARWLPVLVLPLLLLMTIGIARRFNDYGITINRLYLATLNAWFYFVCIGLIVKKARRINWIPISFSIVFLLTSVLPVNYASITKHVLQREVTEILKQSGNVTFPLSEEQYTKCLNALSEEQSQQVNEKLYYLQMQFGDESISHLLADSDVPFNIHIKYTESLETNSKYELLQGYNAEDARRVIEIPDGYKRLTPIKHWDIAIPPGKSKDGILEIALTSVEDSFCISMDTLKAINQQEYGEMQPISLPCKSGKRTMVLTSFTLRIPPKADTDMEMDIEGYLFYNE
ncbi:DUF4153 domain-containing protein [uncultured Bacteroides sp.]|jgi:hypothetical protein|uniref:DUF4153 domain-containing protein n=1 Tax=uncultured Bacteroides sp. TaxID=162156 RepID=UPI002604E5BE|nr:DUF4153 domain-containing protein [uncultured Bacteroides sp.]